jgi:curved DNA-binding protein CbpA
MPVESRSYYVVLGVPRDESSAGIRAAYRDLVYLRMRLRVAGDSE